MNAPAETLPAANGAPLTREDVFAGRCRLVPLRTPQEFTLLQTVAAADQHTVIGPSHLVTKAGEVLGYASLGTVPMLHVWLDRHPATAGDSLRMLETAEALLADKGVRLVIMPCAEHSPFSQHMERLGFQKLGATVLWAKNL